MRSCEQINQSLFATLPFDRCIIQMDHEHLYAMLITSRGITVSISTGYYKNIAIGSAEFNLIPPQLQKIHSSAFLIFAKVGN
jgi:hypothetical protein